MNTQRSGRITEAMQMRTARLPTCDEENLSEETRAELAYLRSFPEAPTEDDPNDWLSQICDNLLVPPAERLRRWTSFSNRGLAHKARLNGVAHTGFSPPRVMRALCDRQVVFVLVGMGAGFVQGVPFPTVNTDIAPSRDLDNLNRLEQALRFLDARPLDHDLWEPVSSSPGFRRLLTAGGMVNIVDELPGVGGHERLMRRADLLDLGEETGNVWVACLEDVIRSKETVTRSSESERARDALHVMMGKETIAAKVKYGL